MTSFSQGRDLVSCTEVRSLFNKTVVEDILSPEEQRCVNMHLNHCTQCRRLFALRSVLPSFVDRTERQFDSGVAAVVEAVRRKREAEQRSKAKWLPLAMAGALAALTVVGAWNLRDVFLSSTVSTSSLPCVPSSRINAASGVFMAYCDSDEPKVSIDQDEIRVILERGVAAFSVDPERPVKKDVIVETMFGEVRVKGTLFAVHVEEDNAWVEVIRGIVEVVPDEKKDNTFEVTAGSGSGLKQRANFRVSELVKDMLIQALVVKPSGASDEALNARVSALPISPDAPPEASDIAETEAATARHGNLDSAEREAHDRPRDGAHHHTASPIKNLIEEARSCLLVRDWKCAASRYQEALKINSLRPGLTTVLISLAKIELRHLNLPNKALVHYETYLQQAPNGPLAEEAFLGMADSYRHMGLKGREVETLRQFIKRYPRSNLSDNVRVRLKKLEAPASM